MAQPTPYDRQANFSNEESLNPTSKTPGSSLDAEFNAAKISLDQTQANLALIQRDDGRLANGAVGADQLADSLSIGFTLRGVWSSPVNYIRGDGVTFGNAFYGALSSHLSSSGQDPSVATTLWQKLVDFNDFAPAVIVDGTITTAKLADDSVTSAKIVAGAIATADIADGAITAAKIADANVTTAKIADANVTTAKIADASVTTVKIADANITTVKIADANVTTAKIADANITTVKIADANVTTAKIADSNVTIAKLETNVQQALAKAWFNLNGTGTIAARDSFSIASFTDNGTGNYIVTFSVAFPNAGYAYALSSVDTANAGTAAADTASLPAVGSMHVRTFQPGAYGDSSSVAGTFSGDSP